MKNEFIIKVDLNSTEYAFDFALQLGEILKTELDWEVETFPNETDPSLFQKIIIWQDKTYDLGLEITKNSSNYPILDFVFKNQEGEIKQIIINTLDIEEMTRYIDLRNAESDRPYFSFSYEYSLNKTALIIGLSKAGLSPDPFLIIAKDTKDEKYIIIGADLYTLKNYQLNGGNSSYLNKTGIIAKSGTQQEKVYINSFYSTTYSGSISMAGGIDGVPTSMPFLTGSFSIVPLLSYSSFFSEVFSIFSIASYNRFLDGNKKIPLMYKDKVYYQQVGTIKTNNKPITGSSSDQRGKLFFPFWAVPIEKEE